MLTKSSREIIKNATFLSNSGNSALLDFYTKVQLLNQVYRQIYDTIVAHSQEFTKEIDGSGPLFLLPYDCYTIVHITNPNGVLVNPSSYYIRNGILHINGPFKLTYSVIPNTLTAPDENELIENTENIPTDGKMYYVEYNEKTDSYDFTTNSTSKYLGKDVVVNYDTTITIIWDGADITNLIDPNNKGIRNIQIDDPYMVVSYNDYTIAIFSQFNRADYNYNCIFGHETYGEVVALKTNEVTGKGMIYKDTNNKYYYASFIPDTILSYPTNALFTLLEYKLAALILSLTGVSNEYLVHEVLPQIESDFYKTLNYGNTAKRITVYDSERYVI